MAMNGEAQYPSELWARVVLIARAGCLPLSATWPYSILRLRKPGRPGMKSRRTCTRPCRTLKFGGCALKVINGNGCRICRPSQNQSAPEVALVKSLNDWLNQSPIKSTYAIPDLRWPSGYNVVPDFAVGDDPIRFVVEYDGRWFHRSLIRESVDHAKTKIMRDAGFVVIRVREAPLLALDPEHDLILRPSTNRDKKDEFSHLTNAVRNHISWVCSREFGVVAWNRFLIERASAAIPFEAFRATPV